MAKTIGKLDNWTDGDLGGGDFIKLEEGSNLVRCVTSPHQFYIHWTKDASGKDVKVHCALQGCPACQQGVKAQAHWFVGIVNRKTNKPAILEMGVQIFKQIVGLSKKDKWGDPRQYDLDIEKQPKGSQPLYVVSPEPKEALSNEDKSLVKDFLEKVDLNKMTVAPTADEIREKLGMSPVSTSTSAESTTTTDDDDFNFDE